ncbi:MAG: hypothetical protein ACHQ1H_00595, partial [Nitrososphaerales archaeon]
ALGFYNFASCRRRISSSIHSREGRRKTRLDISVLAGVLHLRYYDEPRYFFGQILAGKRSAESFEDGVKINSIIEGAYRFSRGKNRISSLIAS